MSLYNRKRRLIKSGLQLRLIAVFFSVACLASIFQIFLVNRVVVGVASELPSGGLELLGLLPSILETGILVTVGVLLPTILLIGVLATHRIAGPIYRFEKYLRDVAMGVAQGPCHLRKNDELGDLCDMLNVALERTRERAREEALAGDSAGTRVADGDRAA
ncbi:MAG: hypothetical protein WD226_04930 [Planctomycetota bacterium]